MLEGRRVQFVKGMAGEYYAEETNDRGEVTGYSPAAPGLSFRPTGDGKYVAEREESMPLLEKTEAAKIYLEGAKSHVAYFQGLEAQSKGDPKLVKQDFRRQKALQRRLECMMLDRVVSPSGPGIETITDEKFFDYMGEYAKAVEAGKQKQSEFQPLGAYAQKLTTKSGTVIRPICAGEVGMKGPVILVLQQAYGTGSSAQVPESIVSEAPPREENDL